MATLQQVSYEWFYMSLIQNGLKHTTCSDPVEVIKCSPCDALDPSDHISNDSVYHHK